MSFTARLPDIVERNENKLLAVDPTWRRVRLGEIAKVINGFPFDSGGFGKDAGVPIVRIRDIGSTTTTVGFTGEIPDGYWVRRGDILVGMDGDFNLARWRGPDALLNQRVCKIVVDEQVYSETFLAHALPGYLQAINAHTSSITVKHLSSKTIADIPLPFPPLAEQKRIADKLDALLARVDDCRERLDRIPGILMQFRQSVLGAATSGALTGDWRAVRGIARAWRDVRLSEIASVQGGVTKDTQKQSLDDEEVPYLRVANVQRGSLDLREIKTIRIPSARLPGLLLRAGDVLFNEGGDLDKLGRGWVWSGEITRCSFQNHVFRARLYDKTTQPKYISWWGNSRGLAYFLRGGKQTTNLASINKTMLEGLPISLPPSDEQAEIVRRVEGLFAIADRLESRCSAARSIGERLTPSLLAKAFRGEFVSRVENGELASVDSDRVGA